MSENKYMEIVKALVVPLEPDAPGDNQFVYMSRDQSLFSLVIAPGSPFLGRLTCLIAGNSQLKHWMKSWWLTCKPSFKHGRKVGSEREAIH